MSWCQTQCTFFAWETKFMLLFFIYLFLITRVYLCVHMCVCESSTQGSRKKVSDPLQLELQVDVN